jgi:hypothetical protein
MGSGYFEVVSAPFYAFFIKTTFNHRFAKVVVCHGCLPG